MKNLLFMLLVAPNAAAQMAPQRMPTPNQQVLAPVSTPVSIHLLAPPAAAFSTPNTILPQTLVPMQSALVPQVQAALIPAAVSEEKTAPTGESQLKTAADSQNLSAGNVFDGPSVQPVDDEDFRYNLFNTALQGIKASAGLKDTAWTEYKLPAVRQISLSNDILTVNFTEIGKVGNRTARLIAGEYESLSRNSQPPFHDIYGDGVGSTLLLDGAYKNGVFLIGNLRLTGENNASHIGVASQLGVGKDIHGKDLDMSDWIAYKLPDVRRVWLVGDNLYVNDTKIGIIVDKNVRKIAEEYDRLSKNSADLPFQTLSVDGTFLLGQFIIWNLTPIDKP